MEINPAVNRIRVNEIQTALNLEKKLNITLDRNTLGADWVHSATGKTYDDVVSPTPSREFDTQWEKGNIQFEMSKHVESYDHPIIDFTISDLTSSQKGKVLEYIESQNYLTIIIIQ